MPPVLEELLRSLADLPFAAFLRSSVTAYACVNAAHIFAIGLVIGSIATLDLRLLGVFREASFGALATPLSRVAAAGVVLAALTGLLLFTVRPVTYAENPAFLTKIALVALGITNALLLRASPHWHSAVSGGSLHARLKVGAALSLAIWTSAVLAGRWIGFLQ